MHISALEEYGVRCILELARNYEKKQLPASEIAKSEGLSIEYVSKILHLFRKTGLITATRGINGGFTLIRSPEKVFLKEVFECLNKTQDDSSDWCAKRKKKSVKCTHGAECSVRPVWTLINTYLDNILSSISLDELVHTEAHTRDFLGILTTQTKQHQPN